MWNWGKLEIWAEREVGKEGRRDVWVMGREVEREVGDVFWHLSWKSLEEKSEEKYDRKWDSKWNG
jgi:hypothetical protein